MPFTMRFATATTTTTTILLLVSLVSMARALSGTEIPHGTTAAAAAASSTMAVSSSSSLFTTSRRTLLTGFITTATAAAVTLGYQQRPAHATVTMADSSLALATTTAAEEEGMQHVYFGVGCFWHIQRCFVQAERERLGRNDKQLTSMAGYAGGTKVGEDGKVCYHNFQRMADYGALGHGEVVGMTIPVQEIVPFTEFYLSLFNPRTKDRVDPQDRGSEYRSLVGIPGGTAHPAFGDMKGVAEKAGFTLVPGKGNDPDTLGKQVVYVYDTAKFPFYQAEVYHQFHNDFQSPPYGKAYNDIATEAFEDGRIKVTGCPDRV